MQKLHSAMPYAVGVVIAVLVYFFPEAKPVACGVGAVLPFTAS